MKNIENFVNHPFNYPKLKKTFQKVKISFSVNQL